VPANKPLAVKKNNQKKCPEKVTQKNDPKSAPPKMDRHAKTIGSWVK